MKTIYSVSNKVWSIFFADKEAAELYLSKNGTFSNGLTLNELQAFENSDMMKDK